MPLTPSQQKTVILGELNVGGNIAAVSMLDLLWTQYDDQPNIDPRLQFLLAKRDLIEWRLGQAIEKVDISEGGVSLKRGQIAENLQRLLDKANSQINAVQRAGAPRVGLIARKVPISAADPPDPLPVEPVSRIYRGDPLFRS